MVLPALALASAAPLAGIARAESLDGGRYGPVTVSAPEGVVRGYVVLFSDPAKPSPAGPDVEALTKAGALVVGVDTRAYFARIRADAKTCDQLVGDAETLSRQLQRRYPVIEYTFPIVAGTGQGGTLAYAILAQAPVNTLAGAISIDPAASLSGIPALCPGAPATPLPDGSVAYGAKATLQGFWRVGLDGEAAEPDRAHLADLAAHGTPMARSTLEGDGAGAAIARLAGPTLGRGSPAGLAALPLVELPAAHPGPVMAVILSGDGGWRDIDKSIAERLQRQGVSVLGWDSLRYFWSGKTPDETADDLASALAAYTEKWKAERVALIGYSFGADVLPFLYDRLPPPLRDRVALVSLLGLAPAADWEISVSGWLGRPPSAAALPLAPALAAMPQSLIQCFYGRNETDSACPSLAGRGAELVETAGGHHFGGDYAGLTDTILAGLARRTGPGK